MNENNNKHYLSYFSNTMSANVATNFRYIVTVFK